MPQIFKVGSYTIFFWMNESNPLEPIHVHATKGVPSQNATKIWITKHGKCLLCNNNSRIPRKTLNTIIKIIEAQSDNIIQFCLSTFGQIRFYC